MAAATFASVIAEFGTATYLSRVCALGDAPRVRAVLRLNAIATIVLVVLFAVITIAVAAMHLISGAFALGVVALAFAVDRYVEVTLAVPVASGRIAPVTYSLGFRRVVALAIYVALPVSDTTMRFGLGLLIGQLLASIYSELWVVRQARQSEECAALRDIARSSIPYFVATMSSQIRWLDSAFVSFAAGAYAAGIYSAADKLVRPMLLVPQTLQPLLLPRSSRMHANDARRDARRLYVATGVGFVIAIPAIIWARPLIELTLGKEFLDAVAPFRIMLAALPLIALAAPLGSLLQGQGEETFVGRISAIFAVVVAVGVTSGALVAGAAGAAIGLGVASVVCTAALVARVESLRAID